jgi:hypothetical protein
MRMHGGPEPLVTSIDPDPDLQLSRIKVFSGLQYGFQNKFVI